jgi:multidrug resistance efflux pump
LSLVLLPAGTLTAAGLLYHFGGTGRGMAAGEVAVPPARLDSGVVCFGHVDVESGVTPLIPTYAGRVVEVLAREGQAVKAGVGLLRLDDRPARLQALQAEADLKAAQAQLARVRRLPQQHQARLDGQRHAIQAAQSRWSAARQILIRKWSLQKLDQMSMEEVHAASDQVHELEAALAGEKEKLRELELIDPQAEVAQAEQVVAARQARLEELQHALGECLLRAPADGEVLRVLVGPGHVFGPHSREPAILFCPDQPRIVRAEVPQEFAVRVGIGQPVVMHDDTHAGEPWRGRVVRVSDWYTQRRSILLEPAQQNDVRTLECIVRLEPGQPRLRIGQRMRVTIAGQ